MIPVVELRGAIPIALQVYSLPLWSALLFSILGNLVLMTAIVFAGNFLFKIVPGVFVHARNAHASKVAKFGKRVVVFFLSATPIPFVGGLTGAVAASVFGVPIKEAVLLMAGGLAIAGIIVSIITLGIANIL
ncbi:MAG: small multi-drug export protein [Candidatus Wildermuthbacteria bacterium]|nr:small multi-drug export protein [Candidatus Wildermuthbacteria bacterium]